MPEMSCKYGWEVRMDHKFPESRDQYLRPRLKQMKQLMGMCGRYAMFYLNLKRRNKKPFIDGFNVLPVEQIYGVPLGGIGGGTIGRGFKGEFCRFQFLPGIQFRNIVHANQFIVCIRKNGKTVYQKVLSPLKPKKSLSSWDWDFDPSAAKYRALYPRAWYTYDIPEQNVQLICEQISPIIPHNYKASCLPVGVFVWSVCNTGTEAADVTIAFSFKNGTGSRQDQDGGCWTEAFSETQKDITAKGVLIHQRFVDMDCTVAVSATHNERVKVSHVVAYNPKSNGTDEWNELWSSGCFPSATGCSKKTTKGEELACLVAAQCSVQGSGKEEISFSLAWDMPTFHFKEGKLSHKRRYTRWFDGAKSLAVYSLMSFPNWKTAIDEWQNPILQDSSLPSWYKSALFNELYFISDGGSVWIECSPSTTAFKELLPGDVRSEYGQFAYLEGHEYRMYNTYDVHYYASFALAMLWPKLQLSLQYDIKDATLAEDARVVKYLMNGNTQLRKSANSLPHDIGDPEEEPWESLNAYIVHDTSQWRDLNTKFVLQVYRDFVFTNDELYLKNMWPVVKIVMAKCLEWDQDGDGLIENSATADQTYDCWIMRGPSAYCGGLWLAALCVTVLMARKLEERNEEVKYQEILERAKKAYNDKLWTGDYYKFDSCNKSHSLSIMADQLCGHWFLKASGVLEEVFPKANVLKTLKTIYENNVLKFKNGTLGAVNGMLPDGNVDTFAVHAEEVWVGVTYGLVATMFHEGLMEEGWNTAKGICTAIFERFGLGFQTPEAIYAEKNCRSLGYMRPLSIWAIQWALKNTLKSDP